MKFHIPFGIRTSAKYFSCISREEYQEIMAYAAGRGVRLEGFKRYSGDISIIKELIDDICVIAKDFPKILQGRKSVIVRLDENSPEDDFATTDRHLVSINAKIFNDKEYLGKEYQMLSDMGKFVKETTYRSIIRHELGHVVANFYRIVPMDIAKKVLPEKEVVDIIKYVKQNLSLYAADYADGREFISECFSAYYSGVDNYFAKEYINLCKEIAKEDAQ